MKTLSIFGTTVEILREYILRTSNKHTCQVEGSINRPSFRLWRVSVTSISWRHSTNRREKKMLRSSNWT